MTNNVTTDLYIHFKMLKFFKAGNGVYLPQLHVGLDYSGLNTRYVFVSHAHSDHIPRSTSAKFYATPATADFMKIRGFQSPVNKLAFNEIMETDTARITFFPAGHILGSAMTLVESDQGNLLYTGDYNTIPSHASEGFTLPEIPIDIFITEATFSLPIYKWKETSVISKELKDFAFQCFDDGVSPVFMAYNLGKAQEIMYLLKDLDVPVHIHEGGFELSHIYSKYDFDLGEYYKINSQMENGIIVCPSSYIHNEKLAHLNKRFAYCSGWAAVDHTRFKLKAHSNIPLSDHLDFFELLDICKKLNPKQVVITHTPNPAVVQHYLAKEQIASTSLSNFIWE